MQSNFEPAEEHQFRLESAPEGQNTKSIIREKDDALSEAARHAKEGMRAQISANSSVRHAGRLVAENQEAYFDAALTEAQQAGIQIDIEQPRDVESQR